MHHNLELNVVCVLFHFFLFPSVMNDPLPVTLLTVINNVSTRNEGDLEFAYSASAAVLSHSVDVLQETYDGFINFSHVTIIPASNVVITSHSCETLEARVSSLASQVTDTDRLILPTLNKSLNF